MIVQPFLKQFIVAVQERNSLDNGEKPNEMRECTNCHHVGVDNLHIIMNDAIFEHVKGFAKSQVAHDVETIKIEPLSHI